LAARAKNPKMQLGEDLPTMVVIRADKATPFGKLNKVIVACQKNGYRKFAMKALGRARTS
jgi:biopolymer transport protein ExbD